MGWGSSNRRGSKGRRSGNANRPNLLVTVRFNELDAIEAADIDNWTMVEKGVWVQAVEQCLVMDRIIADLGAHELGSFKGEVYKK